MRRRPVRTRHVGDKRENLTSERLSLPLVLSRRELALAKRSMRMYRRTVNLNHQLMMKTKSERQAYFASQDPPCVRVESETARHYWLVHGRSMPPEWEHLSWVFRELAVRQKTPAASFIAKHETRLVAEVPLDLCCVNPGKFSFRGEPWCWRWRDPAYVQNVFRLVRAYSLQLVFCTRTSTLCIDVLATRWRRFVSQPPSTYPTWQQLARLKKLTFVTPWIPFGQYDLLQIHVSPDERALVTWVGGRPVTLGVLPNPGRHAAQEAFWRLITRVLREMWTLGQCVMLWVDPTRPLLQGTAKLSWHSCFFLRRVWQTARDQGRLVLLVAQTTGRVVQCTCGSGGFQMDLTRVAHCVHHGHMVVTRELTKFSGTQPHVRAPVEGKEN